LNDDKIKETLKNDLEIAKDILTKIQPYIENMTPHQILSLAQYLNVIGLSQVSNHINLKDKNEKRNFINIAFKLVIDPLQFIFFKNNIKCDINLKIQNENKNENYII